MVPLLQRVQQSGGNVWRRKGLVILGAASLAAQAAPAQEQLSRERDPRPNPSFITIVVTRASASTQARAVRRQVHHKFPATDRAAEFEILCD